MNDLVREASALDILGMRPAPGAEAEGDLEAGKVAVEARLREAKAAGDKKLAEGLASLAAIRCGPRFHPDRAWPALL